GKHGNLEASQEAHGSFREHAVMYPDITQAGNRTTRCLKITKDHIATDGNQTQNSQNLDQGKPEFNFAKQFHCKQVNSKYQKYTTRTDQRLPQRGKDHIRWQPEVQ